MGVTVASRDGERRLRQRDQQEQGKVVGNTVHPGHREEPRLAKAMGDETGGQEAEARSRRAECQSERSGLVLSWEDTIRIGAEKLLDSDEAGDTSYQPAVLNLFGTGDQFHGRQFFYRKGRRVVAAMVLREFEHILFIVHFIFILITSAPPQIIRHQIPEVGDPCYKP